MRKIFEKIKYKIVDYFFGEDIGDLVYIVD